MNDLDKSVITFGELKSFIQAFGDKMDDSTQLLLHNRGDHTVILTSGMKEVARIEHSFTSKQNQP